MYVCLFDIDGTLVHSGGAGLRALRAAMTAVFGNDAEATQVVTTGRTDRAIVGELFEQHGVEASERNWRVYSAAYLEHLREALPVCDGRVLPGIRELLAILADRTDVAVGLLTGNSPQGARHKLEHFGLDDYFAFGGFGDDHANRDDVAKQAMAATQKHLNVTVSPEQVFVIGDTPSDVRCARAVGARAIAVASGWHTAEELRDSQPDLLMHDFADPTPLLELFTVTD